MLVTSDIDFQFASVTHALISLNVTRHLAATLPRYVDSHQVAVRTLLHWDLRHSERSERVLKLIGGVQRVGV